MTGDCVNRRPARGVRAMWASVTADVRRLATALALVVMTTASASAQTGAEHSGTVLMNATKTGLTFDGDAALSMELDYVFRGWTLMGEPVVDCALRVRNLSGRVAVSLMGQRRNIQVGGENAREVAVLHLGFLMHRPHMMVGHPSDFAGSLTILCPHGVLGRGDSQPFNTPSSPGIERFLCANANVPAPSIFTTLPDMLGQDWCADLGGTFLPADQARALLRNGVLDHVYGVSWFQPRIAALGIGIGELVGNERRRLSELEQAEEEAGAEAPAAHDPAAIIARLAAERARAAQAAAVPPSADPAADGAAERGPDRGAADAALQAARAAAARTRDQARTACRANRPTPAALPADGDADAERTRVFEACQAQAPRRQFEESVCERNHPRCEDSAGCFIDRWPSASMVGAQEFVFPCFEEIPLSYGSAFCSGGRGCFVYRDRFGERTMFASSRIRDFNARVRQASLDQAAWERTNTCRADADAARAAFVARAGPQIEERNRQALAAWEGQATACEARAEAAHAQTIRDAEALAHRLSIIDRLRAP